MPVLLIIIFPLIAAAHAALCRSHSRIAAAARIASMLTFAASCAAAYATFSSGTLLYGPFFIDSFAAYMSCIITLMYCAVSFVSEQYLINEEAHGEELGAKAWQVYFGLLNAFTATLLLVIFSNNMGIMWISVEATTLASAFLVGFYRHKNSLEAAWKYLIICSIGIAFAMLGTILLYYGGIQAGTGPMLNWTDMMLHASKLNSGAVKLAFIFAFIGYGTKTGLAPMHTWLPDAHSQAPSPISAMLSSVLLPTAFYALMRFNMICTRAIGPEFSGGILIAFGLLSIAVAAPFIIAAKDIKRMFAYSSIENMGIIALGFGTGTPAAIYACLLHILGHAAAKAMAFMSTGFALQIFGTRRIIRISGAIKASPSTGIPLFISIIALAGLPPFTIFTSKFLLILALFGAGKIKTAIALLVLVSLVFGGLIYHGINICFGEPDKEKTAAEPTLKNWLPVATVFILILVVAGLWLPLPLNSWLESVIVSLAGGGSGV